jgi:hypothetical protein
VDREKEAYAAKLDEIQHGLISCRVAVEID